jgi:Coenzyme PQQ synthesis protein D (PqqD)
MTHLADSQKHWILNDKILSNSVGQSLVLLDLNGGFYYGLSDVSIEIWNLLKEPKSIIDISDFITETYSIDKPQALSDAQEFITELKKMNLIKEHAG